MIKHAMKCSTKLFFIDVIISDLNTVPAVQRIVYSTCSIHAAENEHVVREALKSTEASDGQFILDSPENVLPTWHRRGIPEEMDDPGQQFRC